MQGTIISALALLAALAAAVDARPVAIVFTGSVRDAGTTAPIPGAEVWIEGAGPRVVTGVDGAFRLVVPDAELRTATATLVARKPGFQTAYLSIPIRRSSGRADIHLQRIGASDEERVRGPVGAARRTESLAAEAAVTAAPVATAMPRPAPPAGTGQWNTEEYRYVQENGFIAVAADPLSTFAADVDRASYSNVRRFLVEGHLPPADAVRVEEMINYFPYDYPAPRAGDPVSITTEVGRAPWATGNLLLRVGLQTAPIDSRRMPPTSLVFLIDVSGSMQPEDRLPLVKRSLRMLVDQLRPQDRVAIVVYAGAAGLVLPTTRGSDRTRILDAIERLEAGGSTAGGAGLRLAYQVARAQHLEEGSNRVVLATDGDFNVGLSSDAEMVRLVEREREYGTALTVLGFGRGNLKDAKMEQMADVGNGNFAYIDDLQEARKVLVKEMGGTLVTVAKDVKIQVEFNPARVQAYRLIGYENRQLRDEDFRDDRKDAGELGAGHSVTALYELVPAGAEMAGVGGSVEPLRYQSPRPVSAAPSATPELGFVKVRYKAPVGTESRLLTTAVVDQRRPASPDLTFAAAVAGFGMLLRESEHRGSLTAAQVLELARRGRGDDREHYRADFISLVERYQRLDSHRGGREPGDREDVKPLLDPRLEMRLR